MRAVRFEKTGGPEVLEVVDVALPDPARIVAGWGGTEARITGSLVNGETVDVLAAYNATATAPLSDDVRWDPTDAYPYVAQPAEQKKCRTPSRSRVAAACAGSTVIPHTGSTCPPATVWSCAVVVPPVVAGPCPCPAPLPMTTIIATMPSGHASASA